MIKRETYMSRIRPFIGNDLVKVLTGIRRSGKSVMLDLIKEEVCGIISSWEEMFPFAHLPLLIEATFMPFRNVIISDGLVLPYRIMIGGNMAKEFKEIYMRAKKAGNLHKTL